MRSFRELFTRNNLEQTRSYSFSNCLYNSSVESINSHTEKSNIRTVMTLNNYPLLLRIITSSKNYHCIEE